MITIPTDSIANAERLLKIANNLCKLNTKLRETLPYHMNVISELYANENANSRILRGLLEFSRGGHYPLFESFLKVMGKKLKSYLDLDMTSLSFTNEENRIDLLIRRSNDYAIIIENKIWGAVDQDAQIERYVDYVIDSQIPREKTYVIYLTSDGSKTISDYSLTDRAKKILGMSEEDNGRFLCLNFKDDIIPWLDEQAKRKNVKKEPLLYSAIIQYSDFLKGELGLLDEDKKIDEQLIYKLMNEELKIDNNIKTLLEFAHNTEELNRLLYEIVNKKIEKLCEKYIIDVLKPRLEDLKCSILEGYTFSYNYISLDIKVPNWNGVKWSISTENKKVFYGMVKIQDDLIDQEILSKIKGNIYIHQSPWWPGYEWLGRNLDDRFWTDLEDGSNPLVNCIIENIKYAMEKTKDMNL